MLRVFLALAIISMAGTVRAEEIAFDVRLAGIRAGTLAISSETSGGAYALRGRLQSSGIVNLLRQVRYDATAQGRVTGGRFVPSQYAETTDTGKRRNSAVMSFRGGVPQVKKYDPPRKARSYDVDPSTQGGALDPLTALYVTLRSVPKNQACSQNLRTFDGRRSARLTLSKASESADTIVCSGAYTRVAGFSQKDMNERRAFPMTMTLQKSGDLWRVARLDLTTLYGTAELVRR